MRANVSAASGTGRLHITTLGRVTSMSVRMRAMLVGAVLALAVAPAADAAKKKSSAFKSPA